MTEETQLEKEVKEYQELAVEIEKAEQQLAIAKERLAVKRGRISVLHEQDEEGADEEPSPSA